MSYLDNLKMGKELFLEREEKMGGLRFTHEINEH